MVRELRDNDEVGRVRTHAIVTKATVRGADEQETRAYTILFSPSVNFHGFCHYGTHQSRLPWDQNQYQHEVTTLAENGICDAHKTVARLSLNTEWEYIVSARTICHMTRRERRGSQENHLQARLRRG